MTLHSYRRLPICFNQHSQGNAFESDASERALNKNKPQTPRGSNQTRTARSPSGCTPPRRHSPRVEPLTPERSPPQPKITSGRMRRKIVGDSQTAHSPGANTSRDIIIKEKNLMNSEQPQKANGFKKPKGMNIEIT
ncbi:unnamed protein product [Anisakis simplex]|uniref:Uncharacterized protein n=1 Tax=Anisakis simplex TaxID=6269 RepID=A0A0M3J5D5_ANISI|nr:unnamed protein product [Anisakis simplex]